MTAHKEQTSRGLMLNERSLAVEGTGSSTALLTIMSLTRLASLLSIGISAPDELAGHSHADLSSCAPHSRLDDQAGQISPSTVVTVQPLVSVPEPSVELLEQLEETARKCLAEAGQEEGVVNVPLNVVLSTFNPSLMQGSEGRRLPLMQKLNSINIFTIRFRDYLQL
ncbi:unnamed protein product [Protopolystoma xenopodis]|uniref:Uncharacterized protein n=1 Tax=Protopolystoma xenopodis TaxID=117903 RepID=A0A3S5FEY0_9PLAT|nr:unnamed protein product [Protopolystoma xenopodis]